MAILAANLVFGAVGLVACENGQVESDRAKVRELLEVSKYLDHTFPYGIDLLETIYVSMVLVRLEREGTIEDQVKVSKNLMDHIQAQRISYEKITAPAPYQTLHDLIIASFDATEQSLAMLYATFQRVLLPAGSRRQLAERFQEDRLMTLELLREATVTVGKSRNEINRLVDRLEQQFKDLGATK